ncbi:OprO/OprP family phosphate-selective porin [Parvibaculum sp.]|uniref:OprO/OprP family phosphate-selective porin n=1 Tax=Parvibaculum sp. TaxID=2024848 RepID=UPI002B61F070|nr:porin [Parvibaculum sp.]HUD51854.1 porin [Parvibaculum sp.]
MQKFPLYLGASAIALTLAGPAFAAESADELQKRVDNLEATIDALRSEIADIRKQPEFKPSPNFTTSSGDYAFKFRGQIAADAAFFNVDKGTNDYNDGTQLRRARLGIDGTIQKDWLYRLEIDVGSASRDDSASGEIDVKDAYLQYKGLEEHTTITIGQHKTPNTLEQAISSSDTLFTEIPLFVEAFTNRTTAGGDYKAGVSAKYSDVNWTATLGVFGENYSINGGGNSGGTATTVYKDEGWGPAARLTWAPVNGVTETLHLGVSGYWRDTGGRTTGLRFRTGPEVSVDSTRLVDTGNIAANDYSFAGAELAGQYGPIYLQSEYGRTDVDRVTGSDVSFDGGYVGASWVITGENREYKDGAFARIKPKNAFSLAKGGWGAWEVAGRYSTLDLNDGNIAGGKETNYSLGLNWYPNNYLRFLVDYVHFDAKKSGIQNEGDAVITRVGVIW